MATTRVFLIDSDATAPQPEWKRYGARPVVGTTLAGVPILQGYESLDVGWRYITKANMAILQGLYDPLDPSVTVQYTDPLTGADVTRSAVMEPPSIGGVGYGYFKDVSVRFSRLEVIPS